MHDAVRGTSTNKLLFERLNLHDRYNNEKHAIKNLVSPGVHTAARKATTTDALLSSVKDFILFCTASAFEHHFKTPQKARPFQTNIYTNEGTMKSWRACVYLQLVIAYDIHFIQPQ